MKAFEFQEKIYSGWYAQAWNLQVVGVTDSDHEQ